METSREYAIVIDFVLPFTVVFTHCQANILVDDSDHARIADFGLAVVTKNSNSIQSAPHQHGFTLRWTAPEVVVNREPTKESDMFSFAMVTIEVGMPQMVRFMENLVILTVD